MAICLLAFTWTNAVTAMADSDAENREKVVLGWLQSVRLLPSEMRLTAKLDTGAKSSALHATDIELYDDDQGDSRVRFVVPVEKKIDGESVVERLSYDKPVVRKSKVKRHQQKHLDIRPVVEMEFCLDSQLYRAQFSLDDRSKFNYPMLLGRRFLQEHFVVDPSQTFVKRYRCP